MAGFASTHGASEIDAIPSDSGVTIWMGDEHIVFECDFPHPDSKYPLATQHFLELQPELIPESGKRKILWDNAQDFYRLPEPEPPTEFREPPPEPAAG